MVLISRRTTDNPRWRQLAAAMAEAAASWLRTPNPRRGSPERSHPHARIAPRIQHQERSAPAANLPLEGWEIAPFSVGSLFLSNLDRSAVRTDTLHHSIAHPLDRRGRH